MHRAQQQQPLQAKQGKTQSPSYAFCLPTHSQELPPCLSASEQTQSCSPVLAVHGVESRRRVLHPGHPGPHACPLQRLKRVEGTILTHTHLSLISGRFSLLVLLFLSISRLHSYICPVPQSHIHIFSIFSSHYHIYCVHCSSLLYSRYSVQFPRLVRPVLWSCSI